MHSSQSLTFVFLFNIITICTSGDHGNLKSLENYPVEAERHIASFPNTIYYPNLYTMPYDRSNLMQEKSAFNLEPQDSKMYKFNDFLDAVNDLTDETEEHPQSRSTSKFASPAILTKPLKYQFEKPNYMPWSPNIYPDSSPFIPSLASHPSKMLKPRFGLLESSLKSPGKLGSLLNLFTALLGGSGLNGVKDVFINGILKPLLVSKSSLKAIISKLAIPVVALVLVNVEILVVVWWLWEECPEAESAVPVTPYSQSSNISLTK